MNAEMSEKKKVEDREGLRKIKALIEDFKVVMMASNMGKIPFSVSPMTLLKMEDTGELWFFTSKNSGLYRDIGEDPRVQVLYCDQKKQRYLSIYGHAAPVDAVGKKAELWNCGLLKWFEGKDDPNLVLLGISQIEAFYWDNENNEPVSLFKKIQEAISASAPVTDSKGNTKLWNH